jgi:hypothetical protein
LSPVARKKFACDPCLGDSSQRRLTLSFKKVLRVDRLFRYSDCDRVDAEVQSDSRRISNQTDG